MLAPPMLAHFCGRFSALCVCSRLVPTPGKRSDAAIVVALIFAEKRNEVPESDVARPQRPYPWAFRLDACACGRAIEAMALRLLAEAHLRSVCMDQAPHRGVVSYPSQGLSAGALLCMPKSHRHTTAEGARAAPPTCAHHAARPREQRAHMQPRDRAAHARPGMRERAAATHDGGRRGGDQAASRGVSRRKRCRV